MPSDVDAERAAVDRWAQACELALTAAFSPWPDRNQGASVELTFLPSYRVRAGHEPFSGYAQDGVRLNVRPGEYVVDHDTRFGKNSLIFRDADPRKDGGDLTVDLRDYVKLAAFPDVLDHTQLKVIERRY